MIEQEHSFVCPYCGETITVLLDMSVPSQSYIEDCEICCRPIEISYLVSGNELEFFQAARGGD